MENLTGSTPPVRYLPCVVPCKLYFTFVPKLLVIALVLLALGSWMFKVMDEFVVELFAIMASL